MPLCDPASSATFVLYIRSAMMRLKTRCSVGDVLVIDGEALVYVPPRGARTLAGSA